VGGGAPPPRGRPPPPTAGEPETEGDMIVGSKGVPGFAPAKMRRAREAARMSPAELARRAGVPPAYISKYEDGTAPQVTTLAAIARALAVPPSALLDLDDVGSGLAALRVVAGLSQAEVAEAAGPDMGLSRYKILERGGVRRLTRSDAAQLAGIFGVTVEAVDAAHRHDVREHERRREDASR
jgi:transcriptional regulator with XRE-family HTH domain